jgi:hypothetical protein
MSSAHSYRRIDQTSVELGRRAYLLGCSGEQFASYSVSKLTTSPARSYAHVFTIFAPVFQTAVAEEKEYTLTDLLMRAAERSFAEAWDSPEDDAWDSI